jgi:hypothetical protein
MFRVHVYIKRTLTPVVLLIAIKSNSDHILSKTNAVESASKRVNTFASLMKYT